MGFNPRAPRGARHRLGHTNRMGREGSRVRNSPAALASCFQASRNPCFH